MTPQIPQPPSIAGVNPIEMGKPTKKFSFLPYSAITLAIFCSIAFAILRAGNFGCYCTSSTNACINYLRIIDAAKQQWGIEHNKTTAAIPSWDDIRPYLGRYNSNGVLNCPLGGIYTIGALERFKK